MGGVEQQYRKAEVENKKKWIANKDFRGNFGLATTLNNEKNFVKNYVNATPSDPPMLHKFREEKRDEWIGGPLIF